MATAVTIFGQADGCDKQFEELINLARLQNHLQLDLLTDCQRRFVAWWKFLGVFASPRSSLDFKLRNHDEIHKLVLWVLKGLTNNVARLCRYMRLLSQPHNQSDVTTQIKCFVEAIGESLTYLGQIGTSIRHSSRTTETSRAHRYASSYLDTSSFERRALTLFEKRALQAITSMYPNAPTTLRLQLCASALDRYIRVIYRQYRHRKLESDHRQHLETVRRPEDPECQSIQGVDGIKASMNIEEQTPLVISDLPPVQPVSTAILSSVHQSQFQRNLNATAAGAGMEPKIDQAAKTTFLTDHNNNHEPPIPFRKEFQDHRCRWCFDTLLAGHFTGRRWSKHGRDHYRKDLDPYPCIADQCSEEFPSFASGNAWRQHMRSHSVSWTKEIHQSAIWRCPFWQETSFKEEKENEDEEGMSYTIHGSSVQFSSFEEVRSHILLMHPQNHAALTKDGLTDLTERSYQKAGRNQKQCVLCGFVEELSVRSIDAITSAELSVKRKDPDPVEDSAAKKRILHRNDSSISETKKDNRLVNTRDPDPPGLVAKLSPMMESAFPQISASRLEASIPQATSLSEMDQDTVQGRNDMHKFTTMERHILLHLETIFRATMRLMPVASLTSHDTQSDSEQYDASRTSGSLSHSVRSSAASSSVDEAPDLVAGIGECFGQDVWIQPSEVVLADLSQFGSPVPDSERVPHCLMGIPDSCSWSEIKQNTRVERFYRVARDSSYSMETSYARVSTAEAVAGFTRVLTRNYAIPEPPSSSRLTFDAVDLLEDWS